MQIKYAALIAALSIGAIHASAAEAPSIPGLKIGMAQKDAIAAYDFKEEPQPDPKVHSIIAPAWFPGYWHGEKPYTLGAFSFTVTIHVDEKSKVVDFISLVQEFKDRSKKPDLAQIPAALTEKYGKPLKVMVSNVPGTPPTYESYWWSPGVLIEAVTQEGSADASDIFVPGVQIYYTASDFMKDGHKPTSAIGNGL